MAQIDDNVRSFSGLAGAQMKSGAVDSADVIVAYADVHQAYQIALAAQEGRRLRRFYCSLFARTGRVGRYLPRKLWRGVQNRFVEGIPAERIVEHPWPFVAGFAAERLARTFGAKISTFAWRNRIFDRAVARRLHQEHARVFIGVEGCAADSLRVAKQCGLATILDCPHPPYELQHALCVRAAGEFGLPEEEGLPAPPDFTAINEERKLADGILTTSEKQRAEIVAQGYPSERVFVIPLWADQNLFTPAAKAPRTRSLRILYVGQISLHKGLPYLLQAAARCSERIELTLIGAMPRGGDHILKSAITTFNYLGPMSKAQLAKHYRANDVLVLPSLYESFGFVAMEAMRCGIPVVVTENCGVPVPRSEWRVPVFDSDAIFRRLQFYIENRGECETDGRRAAEFAAQFTPQRFRARIGEIIDRLTPLPSTAAENSRNS